MKVDTVKLLDTTINLFMLRGIRSVTMDDVAREMRISKKTIYAHFNDRSSLVDAAVALHLENLQHNCLQIFALHQNPIEQLLGVGELFHRVFSNMNPSLFLDLKKLFPASFQRLNEHRENFVEKMVRLNLETGIELGYYRPDLNTEIVARLYIHQIELVIDDELFPKGKYKHPQLLRELLTYHLHGISTEKGISYLTQKNTAHD